MPTLEDCLKHADDLAQRVVDGWAANVNAGHRTDITAEYNALLEKALLYRTAKQTADNHREFKVLSEQEAAAETATRQAFAEAYKLFYDEHEAA